MTCARGILRTLLDNSEWALCRAYAPFFTMPLGRYTISRGIPDTSVLRTSLRPAAATRTHQCDAVFWLHLSKRIVSTSAAAGARESGHIHIAWWEWICTTPSLCTSSSTKGPSFQNIVPREDTRLKWWRNVMEREGPPSTCGYTGASWQRPLVFIGIAKRLFRSRHERVLGSSCRNRYLGRRAVGLTWHGCCVARASRGRIYPTARLSRP